MVDNLCDHMIGNVYVKYYHEEDAERALMKLTGEFMNLWEFCKNEGKGERCVLCCDDLI